MDGLGLEGEVTHQPAGLEGRHVHSSEMWLPGLRPRSLTGRLLLQRDGPHSPGLRAEGGRGTLRADSLSSARRTGQDWGWLGHKVASTQLLNCWSSNLSPAGTTKENR